MLADAWAWREANPDGYADEADAAVADEGVLGELVLRLALTPVVGRARVVTAAPPSEQGTQRVSFSFVEGALTVKFGGEWLHCLNSLVFRGFFQGRSRALRQSDQGGQRAGGVRRRSTGARACYGL